MKLFKHKTAVKNIDYLVYIPIKLAEVEICPAGMVTILAPKFSNKLLLTYFVPKLKSPYLRIKLDSLGSLAWLAIDGKKTIVELVQEIEQKTKWDCRNPSIFVISAKAEIQESAETLDSRLRGNDRDGKKSQISTSPKLDGIEERLVKFLTLLYEQKLIAFIS
jgi:hypothetical protein